LCAPLYREQGFITGIYYAQFVQQSRKYQTDKFVYAAIASFGGALFKTKKFNIIWLLQAKHEKNYGLNQEIDVLYVRKNWYIKFHKKMVVLSLVMNVIL
jgi:hypothetical protein